MIRKNKLPFFFSVSFVLFNLFLVKIVTAQQLNTKLWDKRFGGTDAERFTSFKQTNDGGFILGGYSYSNASGDKSQNVYGGADYWVVKIDWLGNLQWEKNFGGTGDDLLNCIQLTSDGGYILGGYSYSDSSGDKTQNSNGFEDYWMVKIDSAGNKKWDKTFGGTDIDWCYSVQQTTDGGFILGGFSYSGIGGDKSQQNSGSKDYWILKTDSIGNKLWDKSYGGILDDWFITMQQTTDNGYILGGFSNSGISGDKSEDTWGGYDYWIVKVDSVGIKQWDKDFGGTSIDGLFAMQQTLDGGYIMGGVSLSGIGGNKTQPTWGAYDYWIIKTDAVGTLQWEKDFGGTLNEEVFGTIAQTADSGFLIAGNSYSNISGDKTENNLGAEQAWIIKTDTLGNKLWDKTVFTTSHDEGGYALETKDGRYVVANSSNANIGGDKSQDSWNNTNDYWIVKFGDSLLTIANNFSNTDTSFCGTNCVDFTSLATNNPTSFQWFFPGADTTYSTLQNPANICYNSFGSFDVTLIACNGNGCDTLTFSTYINAFAPPTDSIWGTTDTLFSLPASTYQWFEFSSGLISGATNQYYIPLQQGTYYCIITDSNGCVAQSNFFVITSIQLAMGNGQFSVFPNPNNGNFEIEFSLYSPLGGKGAGVVSIYDAIGRIVFNSKLTTHNSQLATSLHDGIYFVEVKAGEKVYRKKMVVKR